MKIVAIVTVGALAAVCCVLGARLDGYFAPGAGDGGILDVLLGEMRSALGDMALVRADDYFHRGIRHVECDHFEGGSSEEHAVHPPAGDYIGRINEAIHPDEHVHLSGGSLKEIFPLLGAAIALDPKNEEAYLVAAYWLDRVGDAQRAVEILQQGVKANPGSYLLYADLGSYLYKRKGEGAATAETLEKALSNWNERASRGEEPDQLSRAYILLYLGMVMEREGRVDEAVACYRQILERYPERRGLREKVEKLEGGAEGARP